MSNLDNSKKKTDLIFQTFTTLFTPPLLLLPVLSLSLLDPNKSI